MKTVTLEELLEAGCHFGHQVTRHNPKSREYVFEARDNIHIIDLAKTKEELERAGAFVHDLAKKGGSIIVLGAKRQAEPVVKEAAEKVKKEQVDGMYFVTDRWIGGILTNFPEVMKNFKKLHDLEDKLRNDEEKAKYTKKEVSLWEKERMKLLNFYWGVSDMPKIPDAVFIIDTHLEDLAVREALKMRVTTVGITDTNADPTKIDYPIPANDDAVGSIQLITNYIVEAWIEGRKVAAKNEEKAKEKEEKEKKAEGTSEKKEAKKESVATEEKPKKEATKKAKDNSEKKDK
jgi:small subunit ribosomal protein S2